VYQILLAFGTLNFWTCQKADNSIASAHEDDVIVIPASLAAEIGEETVAMTIYEDFVAEMVAEGRAVIGLYPMTDPANLPNGAMPSHTGKHPSTNVRFWRKADIRGGRRGLLFIAERRPW
jgi:hypothetical protein